VFEATFTIGAYPQGWIEDGIALLSSWLGRVLRQGWLTSLLIDGVVKGCGAVISFLPNIVILFFFFLFWKIRDIWPVPRS
jgi:Fe2+ transport system protein B